VAIDLRDVAGQAWWELELDDHVVEGQGPPHVGHPRPDVGAAPAADGALAAQESASAFGPGATAVGAVAVAPRTQRGHRCGVADEERTHGAVAASGGSKEGHTLVTPFAGTKRDITLLSAGSAPAAPTA
jgi:hypothetical protein